MIDTVSLYMAGRNGINFDINLKEFNSSVNKTGQVNNYSNNFTLSAKDKRNIYIKYDVNNCYSIVTFSVPKLLYGNSLENIKVEDKDAIFNILVGRLNGIFDADLEKWQVSRLDVTKNIEVENSVSSCITALKKAYDINQGRYNFTNVKDESLTINNNSRRFVIYDKVKEQIANKELSKNEAKTKGNILRLEIQHKKARAINTSFKRKYNFDELFTEKSFQDFSKFQQNFFDKFYCNSGQYQMFIQDIALAELIFATYSKRDLLKNFLVKKYLTNDYKQLSKQRAEAIALQNLDFEIIAYLKNELKEGNIDFIKYFQEAVKLNKNISTELHKKMNVIFNDDDVKNGLQNLNTVYDSAGTKDIFKKYYTIQGLNKALRQINTLAKLGTDTVGDVLNEIRYKLVA